MTQENDISTFVINSFTEKFMDGWFFFYVIISESLHIMVNNSEIVENELLQQGLMFVVEEGTEMATS